MTENPNPFPEDFRPRTKNPNPEDRPMTETDPYDVFHTELRERAAAERAARTPLYPAISCAWEGCRNAALEGSYWCCGDHELAYRNRFMSKIGVPVDRSTPIEKLHDAIEGEGFFAGSVKDAGRKIDELVALVDTRHGPLVVEAVASEIQQWANDLVARASAWKDAREKARRLRAQRRPEGST